MIKEAIEKWSKEVQIDDNLKALANIKVIIENFLNREDYDVDILINNIEEEINLVENKNCDIIDIQKVINKTFERIGRGEATFEQYKECIKKIRNILAQVKIPSKYIVISKLKVKDE